MRILVIEDDRFFSNYLSKLIKKHFDAAVDIEADAVDAYEALTKKAYDLVFLDVALCDTNGLALLSQIASSDVYGILPIIVTSTMADIVPDKLLKRYGVKGVLNKVTMHPDDVIKIVRKYKNEERKT